jgi:hypothetical protein
MKNDPFLPAALRLQASFPWFRGRNEDGVKKCKNCHFGILFLILENSHFTRRPSPKNNPKQMSGL